MFYGIRKVTGMAMSSVEWRGVARGLGEQEPNPVGSLRPWQEDEEFELHSQEMGSDVERF